MTDHKESTGEDEVLPKPRQTPLFLATQGARYRRQDAIREIQKATGRKLICYVSGQAGYINRDDVLPLTDLLQSAEPGIKLDLMLHTLGGDVDAAEKIAGLLLKTVGPDGELRVIVPDCAKSAGTLISLAAQSIVMSDTSELGPIDPQIVTTSPDGSQTSRPANSYIDAYNEMMEQVEKGLTGPAIDALIAKFDPVLLDMCRKASKRSRKFAEKFLREGMFRGSKTANVTEIASKLDSNQTWLSHGAVINAEDAQSIGLTVDYRDEHENEWQAYWRLYCEMRLTLNSNTEKLFESDYASLQI
ncbi:SDH family Clp fold serine proteinase [Actinophytocola glycyrrhizae]|uniref:Serine dehydrogenase proteinase n=1 Tax=Actinophytocola glycyrrhizae TaxID=2044873 RepID=A0ABV9SG33_9PSEU